jgi:hypothetical protein
LRRDTECISNPIEKGKHGGDINRLGNLVFFPSRIAQPLHVLRSSFVGGLGNQFYIFQEDTFTRSEAGFVELAFSNRLYASIGGSLNTQEVGMAVQSIRAAV